MSGAYRPPELLRDVHVLDGFECRSTEQTDWLHWHARQSVGVATTRVLVVSPVNSDVVVAYYAWCMASVAIDAAPPLVRKGAGRYPQPVALLARLGVSIHHEDRGLGAGMLRDVILRTFSLGEEIGCRGLLVHAETHAASDFYQHLVPEFEPSPTDDMHLYLLMKDLGRTLR